MSNVYPREFVETAVVAKSGMVIGRGATLDFEAQPSSDNLRQALFPSSYEPNAFGRSPYKRISNVFQAKRFAPRTSSFAEASAT